MFIFSSSEEITLLILHFLKPLSGENLESPLHVPVLPLDFSLLSSQRRQKVLLRVPEEPQNFETSLIRETRFRELLP